MNKIKKIKRKTKNAFRWRWVTKDMKLLNLEKRMLADTNDWKK